MVMLIQRIHFQLYFTKFFLILLFDEGKKKRKGKPINYRKERNQCEIKGVIEMVDLLLHLFCVCTGISWNRSEITTFSPVLRSIFFRLVYLFSFGFFFLCFGCFVWNCAISLNMENYLHIANYKWWHIFCVSSSILLSIKIRIVRTNISFSVTNLPKILDQTIRY